MCRTRMICAILLWLSYSAAMVVSPASAAEQTGGDTRKATSKTTFRFSYTPIYQFETDLDSGGSFDVQRHFVRFDATRLVNHQWMVGIGLSFDYERWNFSGIDELADVGLWDEFVSPGLSIPVFYSPSQQWRLGVIPTINAAGATGAEVSESMTYGVVLSAAYVFGPHLMLGIGGGFFERLDQFEAFPYVVIDWKINDHFRLTNPFQAGPVGPAGLELIYATDAKWDVGVGGAFRSYRFRLDDSSAVADGIGQVDFWALFLRTGYQFGQHVGVDIEGGMLLDGSITIENKNAHELGDTGFDPAPFIGATIRGRF
jgi:hypothetical protein